MPSQWIGKSCLSAAHALLNIGPPIELVVQTLPDVEGVACDQSRYDECDHLRQPRIECGNLHDRPGQERERQEEITWSGEMRDESRGSDTRATEASAAIRNAASSRKYASPSSRR